MAVEGVRRVGGGVSSEMESGRAATAPAPGKSTLIEPAAAHGPPLFSGGGEWEAIGDQAVQRDAVADAPDVTNPVAVAKQATAGAGGPLPHLDRVQASFGRHDVSSIRAHH